MRHTLLIFFSFLLVACEPGGSGTSVAVDPSKNPLVGVPTIAELLENYTLIPKEGDCVVNPNLKQSIISGIGKGSVRLLNFFDYSNSTKNISADYQNGQLNFSIQSNGLNMSCTGSALLMEKLTTISFNCDVVEPKADAGNCQSTFVTKE